MDQKSDFAFLFLKIIGIIDCFIISAKFSHKFYDVFVIISIVT